MIEQVRNLWATQNLAEIPDRLIGYKILIGFPRILGS